MRLVLSTAPAKYAPYQESANSRRRTITHQSTGLRPAVRRFHRQRPFARISDQRLLGMGRRFLRRLVQSPGGALWPVAQGFGGPRGGLVGVAGGAGIWGFIFVGRGGGGGSKRIGGDPYVPQGRPGFSA